MNIASNINTTVTPGITPFVNPTNFPAARFFDLSTLLNIIIPNLVIAAAILFAGMLAYGGFMFMRSTGKAEDIKKAQQVIIYAVAGLIIVLSSFLLVKLIASIFDIRELPF